MFKTIFWRIRNLILGPCVYLGKWDFRLDFWKRNPHGMLFSSILIEVQLWLAFRFEQLHYAWRKLCRSLKSQKGATSLEAMIITGCFVFIAIIACLAMFSQGGQDPEDVKHAIATVETEVVSTVEAIDWQEELEDAQEMKEEIEHEVCCKLCQIDYDSNLTNVTQYSNCLSYCD